MARKRLQPLSVVSNLFLAIEIQIDNLFFDRY